MNVGFRKTNSYIQTGRKRVSVTSFSFYNGNTYLLSHFYVLYRIIHVAYAMPKVRNYLKLTIDTIKFVWASGSKEINLKFREKYSL